jgi:class 3 adenylate cyclase/DNA-binding winged helix-turn-helix (wHTH) protein
VVEVALLGPFETRLDGRPVSLRPKQRALLAALALRAGETISIDRLIDDLWGERPPATATASLQNAVSLTRRALGDGVLVTRGGGYALAVEPERVDALHFERLLADAQSARGEQRSATLRHALALWRGAALADLAFEPFAAAEAPRLDELRLSAREQLAEVELTLGRHEAVLSELAALVESSPFRERPRALLMLALYRSGRQAEALEAFQTTRRVLREELGLEPSPALRALQQAMLRQDPALDPPDAAPLARIVGEERRKTVTVVFCDIVGSTVLAATLDPEAYRAVLRRYYRVAREALERHGGTVEKFVGDAVVAVFGVPVQHEDDAVRAVRAVVELRERVAELNGELEESHDISLRTRIGVNTGEAIAGEPDSGQSFATGYAVNVAAKLQQAAPADGILLGAATYRLVRDAVTAEAVEPLRLGGAAAPMPAFRVVKVDPEAAGIARKLEAPLVGRADELVALRGAFEGARTTGACGVATVLGEAGIGKSRLAAELEAIVADEATVLVGRCVSYGEGATYLPVAEVVRQLVPDGSEAGIAALLPDDRDARLVARRIRELLGWAEGAPPPGEGFWAVRRLLAAVARAQPLLLLLEDVHWAEPTLLDLVDHLAEHAKAPLLVLCLARPDLLESRPSWEDRVLVRLGPLSDAESAALVDNLAGVPDETRARIVEIAEGNALFVEQLHAYAVEAGDVDLGAVPPTVGALLTSRLDRLPETQRSVLERAAVVGREFWRGAVDELSEPSARAELEALTVKGLVRPARSLLEGEEALAFHHVLIRDVAYASITKERRSKLHKRVAGWLASREPDWDEIIGYHLEQAYRLRAELGPVDEEARLLGAEASDRLADAGIHAWKRADASATTRLLVRATALPGDAERRGELLCELALARQTLGDLDGAAATRVEAYEAARLIGSKRVALRADIDATLMRFYTDEAAGDDEVLELAARAIPVLEELGDLRSLGRAWILVGETHVLRCRMDAWREACQHALDYYERAGWSPVLALEGLAAALANGTTPVAKALRICRRLAKRDDRVAMASVLTWSASLEAMRGRFDAGRELLAEAAKLNEAFGRPGTSVAAAAWRVERMAGNLAAAEGHLRTALADAERIGQTAYVSSRSAALATVLIDQGRVDEAAKASRRARELEFPGDVFGRFSWQIAEARVLAEQGHLREALALGRSAADLAATTDNLSARGSVLLDVARILARMRSRRRPADLAQQAAALFLAKGDLVGLASAEKLLERAPVS